MADTSVRTTPTRSPFEVGIDRVWRFFCSVRAAVVEIVLLALLVLIGTLRGSEVPGWIRDYVPVTKPVVDAWYAWDVFHSLVFILLLTVIAIAITVCTINRVPGIWQSIAHPKVTTSKGYLRSADTSASFASASDAPSLAASVVESLKKQRFRVLTEDVNGETHIYADKHRYGKLGTFPFHLALILLLVGGIVGARYGFRNQEFVIPEGSTRAVGHGTGLSVELNRFTDTYNQLGIAQSYESDVNIYKNGKKVKSGPITVNNPISYGTTTFYQSSFGNGVELKITDTNGDVLYNDSLDMGIYHLATNPDAPAGFVQLPNQGVMLTVVGPDVDPANMPQLDKLHLAPGELWLQVMPLSGAAGGTMPPNTKVFQGKIAQLDGMNIEFVREKRFAVLQVADNPGMPIFYTAAFLLVAGLAVTFYFPHRRIRGIVAATANGAEVQLVPLAKRDWSGKRDFYRAVAALQARLEITPYVRQPEGANDWQQFAIAPAPAKGSQ